MTTRPANSGTTESGNGRQTKELRDAMLRIAGEMGRHPRPHAKNP